LCAGHGKQAIQAIQVPVHICGMDIAPGEIVHMDENGAVKFPANKLEAVLKNAKALLAKEDSDIGKVLEVRGKGLKALKEAMVGTADPYMGKR
jgi:regulator of RNase E activity RraA